ncbi:MAG TPA: hypothetical protein VID48_12385 [Solirubrobacteraceae bacterium]
MRLTGSVGLESGRPRCPIGDRVDLLSHAFAAQHKRSLDFAGVPTVLAAVRGNGSFAATGRIAANAHAGTYTITGRCGGGNLGFDVHREASWISPALVVGEWTSRRRSV